jgi:hypothetical protein
MNNIETSATRTDAATRTAPMSWGLKIRRVATSFALAVSVLVPAGMVIGNAAPASAGMTLSSGGSGDDGSDGGGGGATPTPRPAPKPSPWCTVSPQSYWC